MENKEVTKTASSASSASSSSDSSVEEKEEESVVEVKDVLTPGSTSHVGAVPVLALSSSPRAARAREQQWQCLCRSEAYPPSGAQGAAASHLDSY
ncbi:hypothetical protein ADEAN_000067900 [Angomonas deanei]|uniref:Uncharacterized protein n=1 Tax=Angomonas deanei TaxID=59799 RepID=A0A7G2C5M8_9TRYP|nr:hypothetical protein ADEAN_000067900 [Angomonas deanei]